MHVWQDSRSVKGERMDWLWQARRDIRLGLSEGFRVVGQLIALAVLIAPIAAVAAVWCPVVGS
jgi:hypothetical protein